jgi:hypothetical protein
MNNNELDKLAIIHGTDKGSRNNNFTPYYSRYFDSMKNKQLKLLEIGVQKKASLRMWKKFFPKSEIFGIDIDPKCLGAEEERIEVFIGSQADKRFLKDVMEKIGQVDIIIDDGSHLMSHQKLSFEFLFPFVTERGIYVVEDLITSYWKEYVDSPITMITYLKNLIDIVNFRKLNDNMPDLEKYLIENIEGIAFYNSICFGQAPIFWYSK